MTTPVLHKFVFKLLLYSPLLTTTKKTSHDLLHRTFVTHLLGYGQNKQINKRSRIDLKAGRVNGWQSALNYSVALWICLSLFALTGLFTQLHSKVQGGQDVTCQNVSSRLTPGGEITHRSGWISI